MGTLVINGLRDTANSKVRPIIFGKEAGQFILSFLSQLEVSVYEDGVPIKSSYSNNFASLEKINIGDIWAKFQYSLKETISDFMSVYRLNIFIQTIRISAGSEIHYCNCLKKKVFFHKKREHNPFKPERDHIFKEDPSKFLRQIEFQQRQQLLK